MGPWARISAASNETNREGTSKYVEAAAAAADPVIVVCLLLGNIHT